MNLLLTVLLVLATAAVAAAQPSPTPPGKAFVSVNGASHVASNDFTDGADFRENGETAVHLQARAVVPVGTRLQMMLFGGPSFFQVKQDVVTEIVYADTYPYDTASFGGAQTTAAKESNIGFNVGGDVAFFFTRQLGVGFSTQFSGVNVDVPRVDGGTTPVKAGGLQAGGGLRLRF